jgi:beta-galactosidase GanA
MKMAKNQGLNKIQTYVFWNFHEQRQGVLDFSGRGNLSRLLIYELVLMYVLNGIMVD